jgi:hypothetical protein
MKKYVYLIAMAVLAIQFLSCSKSDDEKVLQQQDPVMSRSLSDGTEIPTGAIGGTDAKPVEGQMFYEERSSDIVLISVLGTFSTIDQDDKVEVYNNLGGAVQTKDGGSFTITYKGKGMHIVGSGITHPQTGFTYHTKLSLDIDDASLIESCKATITNIDLSMNTEINWFGTSSTGSAHLSASDIPIVDGLLFTYWKGGTVTDYTYSTSDGLALNLVDNPANYVEVWISFKDGSSVKARIDR